MVARPDAVGLYPTIFCRYTASFLIKKVFTMLKFFPKNIGRLDQVIRIVISTSMIYAGFVNAELIQDKFSSILLGVIGAILMCTVILRSCPLYILIGWNTCHDSRTKYDDDNSNDSD